MSTTEDTITDREAAAEAAPVKPSWPLVVLAVLAIVGAMYLARDVLVPIAFALLLALFLSPLLRRMRKGGLPDLASAFILVGFVTSLFLGGVLLLAGQAQFWLAEAPSTIQKVGRMLPSKIGPLNDIAKTTNAVQDMTTAGSADKPIKVEVQSWEVALAVVGGSSHFIGTALITFVLAFFLLAFNDTLLRQAASSRSSFNQRRNVIELIYNIESGISRYLRTVTIINIGLGIVTGVVLSLLGIPNPILWAVMVAVLNYVPHVGAFLCMVVLFFVGAVTHGSISSGLLCASVFVVLTSVESYFVTPLTLSRSLQLSPLAVILSVLFWGWLWGIPGGLMAAPLLAIAKITCDQFESLHGWSAVLAGEPAPKSPPPGDAIAARSAVVT
jgi:predicted PurR-regulated permease PerM